MTKAKNTAEPLKGNMNRKYKHLTTKQLALKAKMRFLTLIKDVHIKHVQSTMYLFVVVFCIAVVFLHSHKNGMAYVSVLIAYTN